MKVFLPTRFRSFVLTIVAMAVFSSSSPVVADTFISGFEGDLSSTLGVDWTIADALGTEFVADGVTEGTQALSITHNPVWTNAVFLETGALIDIMRTHDTIDLDVTIDGLNTTWRQIFVVTQGTGLNWSQVQVDLVNTFEPFATTNVSLDLTDPAGDGAQNWKAAAQQARDDLESGVQVDEWWQLWFIFQGDDFASPPEIKTIVDNVRFTGGLAADFDMDGDVDGDDFLLWQTGFGIPSGAIKSDGDYDDDGDVDGDDFLGWQAEFGSGGGSASAVVPEPASLMLLLVALIGAIFLARRQ